MVSGRVFGVKVEVACGNRLYILYTVVAAVGREVGVGQWPGL